MSINSYDIRRNRCCLVMVVRDEAPIIRRCFESVKHLFDTYFICDTGSLDNTIEVMSEWLGENGKQGEIWEHPWEGFGPTKSLNLQKFREHPLCSKAPYFMWLDADEVFITDKNNPTSYITEEQAENIFQTLESRRESVFMFQTIYGDLEYKRWQIVRNDRNYDWSDLPVQEFFRCPTGFDSYFSGLFFNLARKEGNSSRNPERHLWDIEQLEKYLERDESQFKPRARFYLADCYRSSGMKDKAINMFKKVTERNENWSEECYVSCLYLVCLCSEESDKVKYALLSMKYNSERLEAIFWLMMHYYTTQEWKKGYAFGSLASSNRVNKDFLFYYSDIYNYRFDIIYSVCAYRAGKYQDAFYASKRMKSADKDNEENNLKNQKYYWEEYKKQIKEDIFG